MAYPKTPTLGLDSVNYAGLVGGRWDYYDTLELEQKLSASLNTVDQFCGFLTASMKETFYASGTLDQFVSTGGTGSTQFYVAGLRVAPFDRIITHVKAFSRMSGSGGVTTIDVQKSNAAGKFPSGSANSLFVTDKTRPHLSASDGIYIASGTIIPASASWLAHQTLGVIVKEAATVAADLTVEIFWKPSGSWYATGLGF